MGTMLKTTLVFVIALASAVGVKQSAAQSYPTKPIRLIVPFPPGGPSDIVARMFAQKLAESFGASVVVDNRPGAAGTIGIETTVRASPDGYTMIMVSGSYAANAALLNLPYDPVGDITPISLIGESGFLAAVYPSVPARTIKDLVALIKAKPGSINYGSTGTGGLTHLATELFNQMAGTKMTHVPYKGMGPALNELLGGQIQLLIGGMSALIPHVKSNRLRGIAVTTIKRSNALPDIPTVAEAVPGYEVVSWAAILGPKALPKSIVSRWNGEIDRILQMSDVKERMAGDGQEPVGGPPERFGEVLTRDVAKWRKVVKAGNVKLGS
jgi:tripartite-type tricarboxylate transporter receptor subunit TctC